MIARTRGAASFTAVMTIVVLVVLTGGAHAGSIVQTVSFQFQQADSNFSYFQQFDPALGTLTAVEISVSAIGTGPHYLLSDETDQPISFTATFTGAWRTDAGSLPFNVVEPLYLPPGIIDEINPVSTGIDLSATYASNLGFWIGTSELGPFEYSGSISGGPPLVIQASVDNPNIEIDPRASWETLIGTETVTYLFSTVPEPPSSRMLGTAAFILAGGFLLRSVSNRRYRLESEA